MFTLSNIRFIVQNIPRSEHGGRLTGLVFEIDGSALCRLCVAVRGTWMLTFMDTLQTRGLKLNELSRWQL